MYNEIKYLIAGDNAIQMEFGNEISKEINAKIRSTIDEIEKAEIAGIIEMIPTYRSITITYDPCVVRYAELVEKLKRFEKSDNTNESETVRLVEIPTCYGGEYGLDIDFIASNAGLSEQEVIDIHTGTDYLVYMLGFAPGFTYLGGLDERIATPRLSSPRLKIPAGSVGIAGTQTGTYPSDSPGGWQLLGRTPLKLYDKESEPPVFINAGDYIRYISITVDEYKDIQEKVNNGEYKVNIRTVNRGELRG